MKRPWHSRPLPLFLALVVFLLVTPEAAVREERIPALGLVALVLFALGTLAVAEHRRLRTASLALLLLTAASRIAFFVSPSSDRLLMVEVSGACFLLLTAVGLMQVTFGQARELRERIEAALATYLLLGFLWAGAYSVLFLLQAGSFRLPADAFPSDPSSLRRASDYGFLYFSFVTLTTLGYGDITPAAPLARALAALEAVVGQLFLAVTIARLVGMRVSEGER